MAEREDIGLAFDLEETELGSPEYREKREVWRNDMESVIRFAKVPTIHKKQSSSPRYGCKRTCLNNDRLCGC